MYLPTHTIKRSDRSRGTAVILAVSIFIAVSVPNAIRAQESDFDPSTIDRVNHTFEELNNLVEIHLDVSRYHADGTKIVRSESDFHMITDVPLDALVETMTDRERQAEILPRVQEYEWRPVPGTNGDVVIETQTVGIRFMGFDATYHLRQRSEFEDRRDTTPAEALLRYEMIESLDGKLESSAGIYLLRETEWEGQTVTYIRQKNVTEIRDTFFGLRGILRSFTPSDTEKLFDAMIDDARDGAT